MANYYYVLAGGIATGDNGRVATTPRTGAFGATSTYYDRISDVLGGTPTTAPVAGDFILVADTHNDDVTSTTNYPGLQTGGSISIVSVDVNNQDQAKAGAVETVSGATSDFTMLAGVLGWYGVEIGAGDDVVIGTAVGAGQAHFDNCVVNVGNSGDKLNLAGDGTSCILRNSTLHYAHAEAGLLAVGGSRFEIYGGSVTADVATVTTVFDAPGSNGGFSARLYGVDLSIVDSWILENFGTTFNNDDACDVEMYGCRLHADVGFVEENFTRPSHRFLAMNCSDDSDAAEYQFYQKAWNGEVEDAVSPSPTRDETTPFGSTDVSIKAVSNANASTLTPLTFDLPARYAELSSASSDILRIYFTCDNTLSDVDIWPEAVYPDGTTKQLYNYISSRNSDILSGGTTHTTDATSTWSNGLTYQYQADLDTSGDAGADSVPIIRIYIGVPSETIFIDVVADTVA